MNRKEFFKTIVAAGTLTLVDPLKVAEFFVPSHDVVLPFINGNETVTLLGPNKSLFNELKAQYQTTYGYYGNYNYGSLAPNQQWYAYQQAVARWQQQMAYWRQQQYYAWLSNMHMQQMQSLLAQYRNQQVGELQPWPQVRSIYGLAQNNAGQPSMIGVNQSAQPVQINNTLKGAAKIFSAVSQHYGQDEAERTVGPQSSEGNAIITLPNTASTLYGKVYQSSNGPVAVSNPDQLVRSSDGKVGQLGKYVTGPDGQQYTVV